MAVNIMANTPKFSFMYLFLVLNSCEIHLRQLTAAVSDVQRSVIISSARDPVSDRFVTRLRW